MYSLILMTAMASSPGTADFNGYFRDKVLGNGCTGTSATAASTSCNGCSCQGGLFSGDRVRSLFSFGGGSCSGTCNGCNSNNYACSGAVMSTGCCGGMVYSCTGGGIDYGTPYALPMTASLSGCFGMSAPSAPIFMPSTSPIVPGGVPMIPPTQLPMGDGTSPFAQPMPAETRDYTPKNQLPLPGGAAPSPTRATVIVKLPIDARLYAEGRPLSLTSGERAFVTPELPQGREYNYTFRIEYERNGRTLSEQRTLSVTPGKVSTLEFNDLASSKTDPTPIPKMMPEPKTATATSLAKAESGERARITVKVPAGATLYVNDAKQSNTEFRTPPLPAGKEFTYTMKIETTVNGLAEQVTQKVSFRAGDSLTVDFSSPPDARAAIR